MRAATGLGHGRSSPDRFVVAAFVRILPHRPI
jgi:hypothetical protein